MTEVVPATRFQNQDLEWLQREGVGLATVDLDKVLTEFNDLELYPGAVEQIDRVQSSGTNVAIVTNCSNVGRLDRIQQQVDVPVFHKGLRGMRGKPAPDMLLAAAEEVPFGNAGSSTVHFDDQIKAWRSAVLAGFDKFVWSRPDGKFWKEHPGVAIARPLEISVGFTAIALLNTYRSLRDIRTGDW